METREYIIDSVRAAGVVGAGGAGFPAHVKLNADVERVLGNGASCEPLLASDPHLMEQHPEQILRGLRLVMKCTGADRGDICLKGKHDRAAAALKGTAGNEGFEGIDIFELQDFYPAGDEQVPGAEIRTARTLAADYTRNPPYSLRVLYLACNDIVVAREYNNPAGGLGDGCGHIGDNLPHHRSTENNLAVVYGWTARQIDNLPH